METEKVRSAASQVERAKEEQSSFRKVIQNLSPSGDRIIFDCANKGFGNLPEHIWRTVCALVEDHLRVQLEKAEAAYRQAMTEAMST